MASLTDIIAALAAKIDDIEAAATAQNAQTVSDLESLTERAHEVLTGIQNQSLGLDDPQGEPDHAMGESAQWAHTVHPA